MADDPLADLLRRTGLDPRPGLEAELASRLGDGGAEAAAATPDGGAPVGAPPGAATPTVAVGPPAPARARRAPTRSLVAAAAVAVVVVGGLLVAALGGEDGGDLVTVDTLPAPTSTAAPPTSGGTSGPATASTTAAAIAPRAVLWSSTLQVGVPAGWAQGPTTACPAPRTVAWAEQPAPTVGRCDDAPGPWVLLEPLPVDLGSAARGCQPAPLVDGTVACELTTPDGRLRRVLVDGQDVLVTAHTPSDPAVAETLRGLSVAGAAAAETAEPPSPGATAAVEAALSPLLAEGCAAVTATDVAAACAALGLEGGGATIAGARFVPAATESGGTARYLVDLVGADGVARGAEVDVAYVWDRAARRGAWQVTGLRPV